MNKFLFLFALLGMSSFSFAQTELLTSVSKEKVPAAVVAAIEADFPDMVASKFSGLPVEMIDNAWYINVNRESANHQYDTYMVDLTGKGYDFKAAYDKDGHLLYSTEFRKNAPLPHAVQVSVEALFPGWTLHKDHSLVTHFTNGKKKAHYVVYLMKGDEHEKIVLDANGNVVRGNKKARKMGYMKRAEKKREDRDSGKK